MFLQEKRVIFNISNTSVKYSLRRSSLMNPLLKSLKKQVSRSISLDTYTQPKPYHVFTHFAVSVQRDMQQRTRNKGNSDAPSVRQKSIYHKKIASTVCLAAFSTKVCEVSFLKRKIAKPSRGNNGTLARNIRKKDYDITAPRVKRVFVRFASPKTTEAMRLKSLKKQCKRIRKTSCRLSRPSKCEGN